MLHFIKHLVGYTLPIILSIIVFYSVGQGAFTNVSLLKSTGVAALFLFGLVFIIGPLPRLWADLSPWKLFRPYWAKWAVLLVIVHMIIGYLTAYRADITYMFSQQNPRFIAVLLGTFAVLYFIFMVIISEHHIRAKIGAWWKKFHVFGYVAFIAALLHFFLAERVQGQFTVGLFLEQAAFAFAIIVLVLRGYVAIWARFDKPAMSHMPSESSGTSISAKISNIKTSAQSAVNSPIMQNAPVQKTEASSAQPKNIDII